MCNSQKVNHNMDSVQVSCLNIVRIIKFFYSKTLD